MENLLPQGLKNLGLNSRYSRLILIALAGLAVILYLFLFKPSNLDEENIGKSVLNNIQTIEEAFREKNRRCQNRAQTLFEKYRSNTLGHSRLNPKEALIIEQNGIIKSYFGEIYHFKFMPMDIGDWAFIKKNKDIYFTRKMADHVFYTSYFCHLEDNSVIKGIKYSFAVNEIKYSKTPILDHVNKYHYDGIREMFFYDHLLRPSNGQLILHLKFSKNDIEIYYKKRENFFLLSCVFLFLLTGIFLFYKRKPVPAQLLWLLLLVDLLFLLPFITGGKNNLYLNVNVMNITFHLDSIYQVLIILLFLISGLYFLRKGFKTQIVSYFLFNAFLVISLEISEAIFSGVNFNYRAFSLDYLSLVVIIFLLHLLPLLFTREMAYRFYSEFKTKTRKQKIGRAVIFLLVQTLVVILIALVFKINVVNILVLPVIAFILLFFKRNFFSRVAIIFLLAVSISYLISGHSLGEKKEFISGSLKKIFLNQGNYAKFIAREIVFEINPDSTDFHEFFQGNISSRLESIWRRSIASRENIASGIYVESKDNEALSRFAYQVPFLRIKTRRIFPFWAIADATAEIHGKEVALAAASIGVIKDSEYLGHIIVHVLNSPELLLRYQDKINIFTIDNKIDGRDLSYIKLNKVHQIVENPSNINLENITGILKNDNQWIEFKSMDLTFRGYIFKHDGNSTIIFFPADTLFKELSEVIEIFLFFSLFFLLFYVKDLKKIDWKSIYYSYSIRVFSFLILISLLTAVVFSIFFINFSYQSSEQKIMRMVYENGRIAQNLGYSLIKGRGEFSKSHLFSISEILNGDVSVYERSSGGLIETSNYRKLVNSQIPVNLHSQILTLLNEKNQKFVLIEDQQGFHLFYKVYNYIFLVEFSNKWETALSEDRYYRDFIITLFFILSIIGFSVAFFFRNKILSPIDGLNRGMAEVERGNLPTLENIPSEIEIKSLYTGFNSMIEGIREQKKSISEISRMKTIIKLGRRVAHEVKNPLTPIKLSAEQILKSLEDRDPRYKEIIKQSVNYIIDETDHLKKVSYGFLDLSRLDEIDAREFDLVELVGEEIFNVRQIYGHIDFSLDVEEKAKTGEKVMVTLDKFKIKQVLKNLINNSIEAIGEKKGEVRIRLEKENHRVMIQVKDNGAGMNEPEFDRAFEADYSTKDIGTGLGLFIVRRIVELHKGHIEIHSERNKGTRVILDLPETV